MIKNNLEIFSKTEVCPVRNILDRFGDKWSILVIMILNESDLIRFNELNRAVGDISQRMLTVTLRKLEADGLVSRKVYPEIPPRVEYQLTKLGKSLVPHIENLTDWAIKNFSKIFESRRKYKA